MGFKEYLKSKSTLIKQFLRFSLVGCFNTVLSVAIDNLFYYVILTLVSNEPLKAWLSTFIAFFISASSAYILNNCYVFKNSDHGFSEHLRSYLKTITTYAFTGIVLSGIIKHSLVDYVDYAYLSIGIVFITFPINFLLNKFWAFRKKNEKE